MSALIILQSDKDELDKVNHRLAKDGMRSDLTAEHKLRYVWRLFQRAESSLKSALEDLTSLRRQQGKEMLEVENYVSHIRRLSDEQKKLMCDYELENSELKEEITSLKKLSCVSGEVTYLLQEHDFPEDISVDNIDTLLKYLLNDRIKLLQHSDCLTTDNHQKMEWSNTENKIAKLFEQSSFSCGDQSDVCTKVESLLENYQTLLKDHENMRDAYKFLENKKKMLSEQMENYQQKRVSDEKGLQQISAIIKLETCALDPIKNKINELDEIQENLRNEKITLEGKITSMNAIHESETISETISEEIPLAEKKDDLLDKTKELDNRVELKESALVRSELIENNENVMTELQLENKRLNEKLVSLQTEKLTKITTINMRNKSDADVNKTNDVMMKQVQVLKDKFEEERTKHNLEKKELAKSYENELNTVVKNHQSEVTVMEDERKRYNKLIVDMKHLREKCTFLEKENNLLKQEIDALTEEKKDIQMMKEEHGKNLLKLKVDHEELLNKQANEHFVEIQRVKKEAAVTIEKYKSLKVKTKDATQERKVLKRSLSSSSYELKHSKEKLEKVTDENRKLETGLRAEKESYRKCLTKFGELNTKNKKLKAKLSTLDDMLTEQTRLIETIEMKLKKKEEELNCKETMSNEMEKSYTEQICRLQHTNTMQKSLILTLQSDVQESGFLYNELLDSSKTKVTTYKKRADIQTERSSCTEMYAGKIKSQNKDLKQTLKEVIEELNTL